MCVCVSLHVPNVWNLHSGQKDYSTTDPYLLSYVSSPFGNILELKLHSNLQFGHIYLLFWDIVLLLKILYVVNGLMKILSSPNGWLWKRTYKWFDMDWTVIFRNIYVHTYMHVTNKKEAMIWKSNRVHKRYGRRKGKGEMVYLKIILKNIISCTSTWNWFVWELGFGDQTLTFG